MSGSKLVHVAVGVVFRADGAVLFGQRVPGKPYAGWWEFPGGKLEAGESVEQALVRELREELGIEVQASLPWVVRDHIYPHAAVRLHFCRVTRFAGDAQSREGQQFVWQQPHAITVGPMLPAALPVIEWLRLPTRIIRLTPSGNSVAGLPAAGNGAQQQPVMLLADCGCLGLAESEHWIEELRGRLGARISPDAGPKPELLFSAAEADDHWHARMAPLVDGWLASREQAPMSGRRTVYRRAGLWCRDAAEVEAAAVRDLDFVVVTDTSPDTLGALAVQTRLPLFAAVDPRLPTAALLHGVLLADS